MPTSRLTLYSPAADLVDARYFDVTEEPKVFLHLDDEVNIVERLVEAGLE